MIHCVHKQIRAILRYMYIALYISYGSVITQLEEEKFIYSEIEAGLREL